MKFPTLTTADLEQLTMPNGKLRRCTMIGSYPIFYLTCDECAICHNCATDDFEISVADPIDYDYLQPRSAHINWEDPDMYCDKCSQRIESAYVEEGQDDNE